MVNDFFKAKPKKNNQKIYTQVSELKIEETVDTLIQNS